MKSIIRYTTLSNRTNIKPFKINLFLFKSYIVYRWEINLHCLMIDLSKVNHHQKLLNMWTMFVSGWAYPPSFRDIFQLYCALGPGVTVKDICTRFNPHALKIDERWAKTGQVTLFAVFFYVMVPGWSTFNIVGDRPISTKSFEIYTQGQEP
jgi:hypothetical protein